MKKTRVNKKILNACGAALALSLIAANVNYYSVEVDASTVSVNGQATTVIPGSLSMKSPAALSTLALPASAFGTLSWANPSTVPSQYSGSYPVVLKVTDTKGADFSKVPGWNAANSTVSGSVTVVVQSLAPATPAPTATPAATPVPTQAAETPAATPVPTQAPATPAPTQAAQETLAATPTPTQAAAETPIATPAPTQAAAETPIATPAPTQAPQTSAEPSAEPTPTEAAEQGTETPASTVTPAPTESKTPEATATPAPTETNTPNTTETPSETGTPDATATPAPSETGTPDATETPAPSETETPGATETPAPSETEAPDTAETPAVTETPVVTEAPELPGAPSMEEKFPEQQRDGQPQYVAYEIYDEDAETMMEEETVAAPSAQNNNYKIAGSKPLVGGDIANSGYGGGTAKPSATPAVSSSGTSSNRTGTTGSSNTGTSNSSSNRTNSGTTGSNGSSGSSGTSGTNYNTSSASRSQNNSVAMVTTKRYGVLTGDDTEIFPYAATGIFSLLVAAFTFFTMHSRRKVVSTVSEEDDK